MSLPTLKPAKTNETGCVPALLFLMGILLSVLSTVGFIFGLFGKKTKYKGMDLGLVDLPTYLGILAMAAIAIGSGFLIDFIVRKRRERKAGNQ
jgi:hypothetical protein